MIPVTKSELAPPAERQALIRLMEEINAKAGIFPDPDASIERLHEMMQADGVRPEDNGASSEIMRLRYGGGWDKE